MDSLFVEMADALKSYTNVFFKHLYQSETTRKANIVILTTNEQETTLKV